MIKFKIGGKTVDPRSMADALMATMLDAIRADIEEKVGTIRDPDTGEFPTVIVRGDNIDSLTLHVEGSARLVALVEERLGIAKEADGGAAAMSGSPRVFLSYTSDNTKVAQRIAEALQSSGIETWFDKWRIGPGDSLRQK